VSGQEKVIQEQHGACTNPCGRLEGLVEIIRTFDRQLFKLNPEALGRCLRRSELSRSYRTGRVPKNTDPRERRDDFPDELEPLGAQVGKLETHSGDVSLGPSETGYEAGFCWIRDDCHHDRDRAGGLLQGQSRGRGFDGDDIHLETDQLARQGRQSIRTTVGIAILDDDVLSLAVAKIPEALPKPLAPERDIAGREGCEKSYARNLPVYSARPESWARREESPAHKTRRKKEKRRREGGGQA
jgi:hypothetical protein